MLGIERQNYIIRLLEEKKFLRLSELVEQLRASEATIRRDLNTLEKKRETASSSWRSKTAFQAHT